MVGRDLPVGWEGELDGHLSAVRDSRVDLSRLPFLTL